MLLNDLFGCAMIICASTDHVEFLVWLRVMAFSVKSDPNRLHILLAQLEDDDQLPHIGVTERPSRYAGTLFRIAFKIFYSYIQDIFKDSLIYLQYSVFLTIQNLQSGVPISQQRQDWLKISSLTPTSGSPAGCSTAVHPSGP